jgi:hypothetical protein
LQTNHENIIIAVGLEGYLVLWLCIVVQSVESNLFLSPLWVSQFVFKAPFKLCQDNFKVVRNVSFVHTNSPDDDFPEVEEQNRPQNPSGKNPQEALGELIILSLFKE